MLPILDEVVGSMVGSISLGPALSNTAGTLTMEGTGEDITEEGMGAIKMHQNASKRVPSAHTMLVHNLYIVDNIS